NKPLERCIINRETAMTSMVPNIKYVAVGSKRSTKTPVTIAASAARVWFARNCFLNSIRLMFVSRKNLARSILADDRGDRQGLPQFSCSARVLRKGLRFPVPAEDYARMRQFDLERFPPIHSIRFPVFPPFPFLRPQ